MKATCSSRPAGPQPSIRSTASRARSSGALAERKATSIWDGAQGPTTSTTPAATPTASSRSSITVVNWGEQSRGIVVEIDEDAMGAKLIGEYTHPDKIFSDTQGNVQVLPNGNVFVGWGSEPYFSEFNSDGKLIFDAGFTPELESYRAFRFSWKGHPQDAPAVVADSGTEDKVTLYVSWNGATEVATWQVLAGGGPDKLEPVGSAPRKGFETALTLQTDEPYVAVQATDSAGRVLGTSKTLKPGG